MQWFALLRSSRSQKTEQSTSVKSDIRVLELREIYPRRGSSDRQPPAVRTESAGHGGASGQNSVTESQGHASQPEGLVRPTSPKVIDESGGDAPPLAIMAAWSSLSASDAQAQGSWRPRCLDDGPS